LRRRLEGVGLSVTGGAVGEDLHGASEQYM